MWVLSSFDSYLPIPLNCVTLDTPFSWDILVGYYADGPVSHVMKPFSGNVRKGEGGIGNGKGGWVRGKGGGKGGKGGSSNPCKNRPGAIAWQWVAFSDVVRGIVVTQSIGFGRIAQF